MAEPRELPASESSTAPPPPWMARVEPGAGVARIAGAAALLDAGLVIVDGDRTGLSAALDEPTVLVRIDAGSEHGAPCRGLDGPAADGDGTLGCPADAGRIERLEEATDRAVEEAGGVLLDGLDRRERLGPLDAGACPACVAALAGDLARRYGEPDRFTPPRFPAVWLAERTADGVDLAFGREHLLGRLARSAALARRLVEAARTAGRRHGREATVAIRARGLSPLLPGLAAAADAVLLAGVRPTAGRLAIELCRAAGRKPVALEAAAPFPLGEGLRDAYAAAALGCDLAVPALPGPAADAIRTLRLFRDKLRPAHGRLADVAVIYDGRCDLLSDGRHGRAAAAAADALAAAGLVVAACTRIADAPAGAVLLLADAPALPLRDARTLLARLEAGARAVILGEPGAVDDEGFPVTVFGKLAPGEAAVGKGRLILAQADAPGTTAVRLCREAVGEPRRLVRISGRGQLLAGAALDRRGARLSLANLALHGDAFVPPQGLVLHLGGPLAEAGVARLLAPGQEPGEIRINRSARGTTLVLPRMPPYAVLELE